MNQKREIKKNNKLIIATVFILGFISSSFVMEFSLTGLESATHITIVYSSEKASWMTIAYTNFLDFWEENNPDDEISVTMHPYGSSDSMIAILNGEIFPTIWSPASSIWLPFLNTKWQELKGTGEIITNSSSAVRLIYSPIVIATWENFNSTHSIKSLADVRRLSLESSVNVRMAHTDPRLSNSGFMTTIMAVSAASNVASSNLTMDDLTDSENQQWLRDFESDAVIYGKSTGFLARYMKNSGPEALNIAFLYENLITDISTTSVGGRVIAIYPEEGTLYSDHPFSILNGNWITPKQREVANAFLDFLRRPETVISAMEYGFRPINTSIPLDPNVFNYETNGIAYNLTTPEMKVPEDGQTLLKIPDLWLLSKSTA